MNLEQLHAIQLEMEEEAVGLGRKRYWKEVEREELATTPGRRLLNLCVSNMIPELDAHIASAKDGVASRNAGVLYMMEQLPSDLLCIITCTKLLQAMSSRHIYRRTCNWIGQTVEDQVNLDYLETEEPKLFRQLRRKLKGMGNEEFKHVVIHQAGKKVLKQIKWGRAETHRLGSTLLEICMAVNPDVAEIHGDILYMNGKTVNQNRIQPTEEMRARLLKAHTAAETLHPQFFPMVVQPKQWSTPLNGGYLTKPMRQPFVKTHNANFLRELTGRDLSTVYASVNALQNTAWSVNSGVLAVVEDLHALGGGRAGLPPLDNMPLPVKTFADNDEVALAKWKRRAAEVYEANAKMDGRREALAMTLEVARRMGTFERFYFAHNVDWRGRVYSFGSYLQPQGHDLAKGLLHFADGKPLGEMGTYWLAVHGANCYGVDKVTFDERVEWTLEHSQEIIASAIDPLVNTFWMKADGSEKAWQFLAFCKEWAGLQMWVDSGREQADYVSYIPVGLDGSCNGLQNFSMAARDEVGGAATNLVPGDKPADIYQRVADESAKQIEQDLLAVPEARIWHGKVTRKLAKRPTMTMPYGSGRFGFKDQLLQTCSEIWQDTGVDIIGTTEPLERFMACQYLAGVMDNAISKVVVKAREVMDWLQQVSAVAAQDDLPVNWTAPSGLPVSQSYKEQNGKELDFTVLGRRIHMTIYVEGTKLNTRKQRQGIAPNFVHSLDAAHLIRTVQYTLARGVTSYAMVHDSYGTHAGDVEIMAEELRRAFVDQYTEVDVLAKFRQEIINQLTDPKLIEKVPPVPAYGTLDPQAVLNSEYFFA